MDVVFYDNKSMNLIQNSERKYGILFLGLIIVIIVSFPFANLFHLLYPFTIFGKSAWIVLPTIIIGLCYIYIFARKKVLLSIADMMFITLVVLGWLIIAIRESVTDNQQSYLNMRFIATSLLFLLFMRHLLKDTFAHRVIAYAVVIECLLVAAARSINYYFFPSFMVSPGIDGIAFINTEGDITRDLLLGSSISGNYIVCGMFVLLALKKHKVLKLSTISFMMIQFFLMVSVFNTLSRFPIAMAIGLFIFSFFNIKVRYQLILVIVSLIVFIGINNADIGSLNFINRFSEGSGDRLDKLLLTLDLILSSPVNFLIGPSFAETASASTDDGVGISDNSYGHMALFFGVPFAIAYFTFLLNIFIKTKSDNLSSLFFAYTFINLGLTNSILWEPWVFTAFSGFIIVSYLGRIPIHQRHNSSSNRANPLI